MKEIICHVKEKKVPDVVFFDTEVFVEQKSIRDIGAVKSNGGVFHSASVKEFMSLIKGADFLCGHKERLDFIYSVFRSRENGP